MFQLILFLVMLVNCTQSLKLDFKKENKIIGSVKSLKGEWPWQVMIVIGKKEPNVSHIKYICGGSILNNRWILTAAHCFENKTIGNGLALAFEIFVAYGEVLKDQLKYKKVVKVKVYNVDRNYLDDDVALLQTEDDIEFSTYVKPISLTNGIDRYPDQYKEYPDQYKECVVSGFGTGKEGSTSDRLMHAYVNVLSHLECFQALQQARLHHLIDSTLCSFNYSDPNGSRNCVSNKGGCLACKQLNRWVQVGITSFRPLDCSGSFYARVSKYYDWIIKNIQ